MCPVLSFFLFHRSLSFPFRRISTSFHVFPSLFSSFFIFLRNMSFRFIMAFHKFPKRSFHFSSSFFVCFLNLFFTCLFHLYFKCLVRVLFSHFHFYTASLFHHFGEVFFRFIMFHSFPKDTFCGPPGALARASRARGRRPWRSAPLPPPPPPEICLIWLFYAMFCICII